ncbi:uncharacterized protein LOC131858882 [Cryptomeria japonica]|uniref:uncharacterized protein LOC131858882 n=1 Tax=Cryptomeria japonica TaxID=3369 RepID=UPI0027DA3986|nr:uncharacterized protein LOC131858882 [Cryptomeria japonica]
MSNISGGEDSLILFATDYFTNWVEAIPTKYATSKVVIKFMEDHIITKFGVPARITVDNGMSFHLDEFTSFCGSYGINILYSSPYHPQANGKFESSNKNILKIIKKMLGQNKRSWVSKLEIALWVDRITIKKATSKSPFEWVYGTQERMLMHNLLSMHGFIVKEGLDVLEPMKERMEQLVELDEVKLEAQKKNIKIQQKEKYLYDKKAKYKKIQIGDLVLMWNSRARDKGRYG